MASPFKSLDELVEQARAEPAFKVKGLDELVRKVRGEPSPEKDEGVVLSPIEQRLFQAQFAGEFAGETGSRIVEGGGKEAVQIPLRYAAGLAQAVFVDPIASFAGEIDRYQPGVRPPSMQDTELEYIGDEGDLVFDPLKMAVKEQLGNYAQRRFFKAPLQGVNLTSELEKRHILIEANLAEKVAQWGGEIHGMVYGMGLGARALRLPKLVMKGKALKELGLRGLGNAIVLGGTAAEASLMTAIMTAQMRQQARNQGVELTRGDYIKTSIIGGAALPIGMGVSWGVVKGIEKMAAGPVGQAWKRLYAGENEELWRNTISRAKEYGGQTSLGATFEAGGAILETAPGGITKEEWEFIIGRSIAGAIAFRFAGAFHALYGDGPHRPYTESAQNESMKILLRANAEWGIPFRLEKIPFEKATEGRAIELEQMGYIAEEAVGPIVKTLSQMSAKDAESLIDLQRDRATLTVKNSQAPLFGKGKLIRAEDLQRTYGLSPEDALRIAKTKATAAEIAEIKGNKVLRARQLLAMQRGKLVEAELRYSLPEEKGGMNRLERATYESGERAQLSAQERKLVQEQIPSEKEALDWVRKNSAVQAEIEGYADQRMILEQFAARAEEEGAERRAYEESRADSETKGVKPPIDETLARVAEGAQRRAQPAVQETQEYLRTGRGEEKKAGKPEAEARPPDTRVEPKVTRGKKAKAAAAREWPEDPLLDRFDDLYRRTSAAEKDMVAEPWTPEQRRLYESGDWKAFSKSRGYTKEQIKEYGEYLKVQKKLADKYGDDFVVERFYELENRLKEAPKVTRRKKASGKKKPAPQPKGQIGKIEPKTVLAEGVKARLKRAYTVQPSGNRFRVVEFVKDGKVVEEVHVRVREGAGGSEETRAAQIKEQAIKQLREKVGKAEPAKEPAKPAPQSVERPETAGEVRARVAEQRKAEFEKILPTKPTTKQIRALRASLTAMRKERDSIQARLDAASGRARTQIQYELDQHLESMKRQQMRIDQAEISQIAHLTKELRPKLSEKAAYEAARREWEARKEERRRKDRERKVTEEKVTEEFYELLGNEPDLAAPENWKRAWDRAGNVNLGSEKTPRYVNRMFLAHKSYLLEMFRQHSTGGLSLAQWAQKLPVQGWFGTSEFKQRFMEELKSGGWDTEVGSGAGKRQPGEIRKEGVVDRTTDQLRRELETYWEKRGVARDPSRAAEAEKKLEETLQKSREETVRALGEDADTPMGKKILETLDKTNRKLAEEFRERIKRFPDSAIDKGLPFVLLGASTALYADLLREEESKALKVAGAGPLALAVALAAAAARAGKKLRMPSRVEQWGMRLWMRQKATLTPEDMSVVGISKEAIRKQRSGKPGPKQKEREILIFDGDKSFRKPRPGEEVETWFVDTTSLNALREAPKRWTPRSGSYRTEAGAVRAMTRFLKESPRAVMQVTKTKPRKVWVVTREVPPAQEQLGQGKLVGEQPKKFKIINTLNTRLAADSLVRQLKKDNPKLEVKVTEKEQARYVIEELRRSQTPDIPLGRGNFPSGRQWVRPLDWTPAQWFQNWQVSLGAVIGARGAAGKVLLPGLQRVVSNWRRMTTMQVFELRTLNTGKLILRPHERLSKSERKNLIEIREAEKFGRKAPEPKNDKVRVINEFLNRILDGKETRLDGDLEVAVQAYQKHFADWYAWTAAMAMREGLPFMPLLNKESQSYWPMLFRKDTFNPRIMEWMKPFYGKRLAEVEAMREAIHKDAVERGIEIQDPETGLWRPISRAEVDHVLNFHDKHINRPLFGGTIDEMNTWKNPFLEKHRMLDVRIGIEYDPAVVADAYFQGALKRIFLANEFGPRMERARDLLRIAELDGWDVNYLKRAFDVASGQDPTWQRDEQVRWLNEVSGAVSLSTLGLSQISQLTSWARTTEHIGYKQTLQGLIRAIPAEIGRSQYLTDAQRRRMGALESARFVAETGASLESEYALAFQDVRGFMPKAATYYLTGNLMLGIDRMGRQIAAIGGRSYFRVIRQEYMNALDRGDQKGIKLGRDRFRELFDDPWVQDLAAQRYITNREAKYLEVSVGETVVNRAHGRTQAIDLPLMASHPYGGHVFKLQTFNFRMTSEGWRVVLKRLRNPADRFKWLAKTTAAFGASSMIWRLRREVSSRDWESDPLWKQYMDMFSFFGFMSVYLDAYMTVRRQYGDPRLKFFGPTYNRVGDLFYDHWDVINQDSWTPAYRFWRNQIPEPWRSMWFPRATKKTERKAKGFGEEEPTVTRKRKGRERK